MYFVEVTYNTYSWCCVFGMGSPVGLPRVILNMAAAAELTTAAYRGRDGGLSLFILYNRSCVYFQGLAHMLSHTRDEVYLFI